MEIVNKEQRTKAYWFFVLFFVITVTIVVIAMFANVHFPFEENKLLKEKNAKLEKDIAIQNHFAADLEKVKVAVDSIGVSNLKDDFFNEKLALSILADMYKQLPKDTLNNKNMYNNTILVCKQYIDAKKHIKKLTADRALLDSLNDINQILQEEYDKMKVDLEVCKQLYQNQ
nr:type VI secretion system TssO [uncultured Capnocytophaga sp.]